MPAHPPTAVRFSLADRRYLQSLDSNNSAVGTGAQNAVNILRGIEANGLAELRGVFTPNEWHAVADMLRGHSTDDIHTRNDMFVVIDSPEFNATYRSYRVDINTYRDKIQTLNCAQVFALMRRVYRYWEDVETVCELPTDEQQNERRISLSKWFEEY